jgi:hypothetical protein
MCGVRAHADAAASLGNPTARVRGHYGASGLQIWNNGSKGQLPEWFFFDH